MQVIRADAMGLCFGVRDALELAWRAERPTEVTIHGELVHNEVVQQRLADRGFATTPEADRDRLPATARVLITAHGVSDAERRRLTDAGLQLLDTTCPLVRRAHAAALRLAADGYHVLVLGRPGHVEVVGLTGDLEHFDVVPSPQAVRRYAAPRLGVLSQTTMRGDQAAAIVAAIKAQNPHAELRFVDTICEPTKRRVAAAEALAARADAMVVVGGRNSNNTAKLAALCAARGTPTFQVQGPADLDPRWFSAGAVVGLTAGTSTLDETVAAVYQALRAM